LKSAFIINFKRSHNKVVAENKVRFAREEQLWPGHDSNVSPLDRNPVKTKAILSFIISNLILLCTRSLVVSACINQGTALVNWANCNKACYYYYYYYFSIIIIIIIIDLVSYT